MRAKTSTHLNNHNTSLVRFLCLNHMPTLNSHKSRPARRKRTGEFKNEPMRRPECTKPRQRPVVVLLP